MFRHTQPPLSFASSRPVAAVIDTTARWLSEEDELALGCECADPRLQIELWRQETVTGASSAN